MTAHVQTAVALVFRASWITVILAIVAGTLTARARADVAVISNRTAALVKFAAKNGKLKPRNYSLGRGRPGDHC